MYLPRELFNVQVLVTVKTYPLPSSKYGELVCTAGILNDGKWIRIYPVSKDQYTEDRIPKYSIIELDLIKNDSDFRPESYKPLQGIDENIRVLKTLGTETSWRERKAYVLKEVFLSMNEIIKLAKGENGKSLATLKPSEVLDVTVQEIDRNWKAEWLRQSKQGSLFTPNRKLNKKVPYKYSYKFLSQGDSNPRELLIEDWEIGSLFWNCLKQTKGDETAANLLVRKKYLNDFLDNKDLYLFLGTTKSYHNVAPNPFVIIGVFYPPNNPQMTLI